MKITMNEVVQIKTQNLCRELSMLIGEPISEDFVETYSSMDRNEMLNTQDALQVIKEYILALPK